MNWLMPVAAVLSLSLVASPASAGSIQQGAKLVGTAGVGALVAPSTASSAAILLRPAGESIPGVTPATEFLVDLTNGVPLQGLQFELAYDPAVVRIENVNGLGRIRPPIRLLYAMSSPGSLRVVLFDPTETRTAIDAGADAILSVRFAAITTMPRNPLQVSLSKPLALGGDLAPVALGSAADLGQGAPTQFALVAEGPNPFAESTSIRFDVPRPTAVSIGVYDITGRSVRVLANGTLPAGRHAVRWDGNATDGSRSRPGVFFIRMVAGGFSGSRTVLLLP